MFAVRSNRILAAPPTVRARRSGTPVFREMLWSLAPAPVPAPVRIPWPASSAAPTYRPRPSSPSGSVACIWANILRRCACRSAFVSTCCLCDFHPWRGEPVPFLASRHAVQPVCACCEWPKLKVCFSSIFFLFLVNFVVALTAESGSVHAV